VVTNEAHVDAVESVTHRITIADQPRYDAGDVWLDGHRSAPSGPQPQQAEADGLHRRRQ
jgi:hypothetical protein